MIHPKPKTINTLAYYVERVLHLYYLASQIVIQPLNPENRNGISPSVMKFMTFSLLMIFAAVVPQLATQLEALAGKLEDRQLHDPG